MPENQVKKLYKRMKLTEREVANFLDISRGKLRKALNSDQPPMWFEYALKGLADKIELDGLGSLRAIYFENAMVGNEWGKVTARQAVPILVKYAKKGKTLTYGELDTALKAKHPERGDTGMLTKYSYPLGYISKTIERYRQNTMLRDDEVGGAEIDSMPPITTIVVRKDTNKPGSGLPVLVRTYLLDIDIDKDIRKLNSDDQIDFTIDKIFKYDGWDKLLELTTEAEDASTNV